MRGAHLLDWSADPSHNRSVFTMVGGRDDLAAAVLRLFTVAVEHIDLRRHRGEHPRIGAVDVVPFVPLGETPMDDCVDLARRVGHEVADRFGIPVFWYEEAAVNESRRPLEAIRRGQFEGFSAKMRAPGWSPDCGPATPHPSAGASAVGARAPLIAFNVNLTTDDVAAARRIAGKIRERDGGLPGVKALGIRLRHRGIAQVSTNVVDYRRSSLETVLDAVLREAAALGVEVGGTELVGLVPAEALPAAGAERLSHRRLHAGSRARRPPSSRGRGVSPVRRAEVMPNARILRWRLLRSTRSASAVCDTLPACAASACTM